MPRAWVWLQVLSGWLPVWAIYTASVSILHGVPFASSMIVATRSLFPAMLLGLGVHRLARRRPWPRPFRLSFAMLHVIAAPLYAGAWLVATSVIESSIRGRLVIAGPGILPFLTLGVWLYVMVAGISYAIEATARAAHAEAIAARTQLAALRAQLHPHFLFNALHTVVQLIPVDPARAGEAAERVAALLRRTVEEDRDLVAFDDEWDFVSGYLDVERLRFGDRLRVHSEIDGSVRGAHVPSFALQTLVENAIRHGAAPRIEPTDVTISASTDARTVTLRVRDTGAGTNGSAPNGTWLARLRERLAALYGGAARLTTASPRDGGFEATLVIPRDTGEDAE